MARAELEETWIATGDVKALRADLMDALDGLKMHAEEQDDGEIVAHQGSQFLTRLLGGWFVPAGWLPKRAVIRLRRTANGVRVRVTFEETMGFGFLDPILKKRYQTFFATIMDDLHDATGGPSAMSPDE